MTSQTVGAAAHVVAGGLPVWAAGAPDEVAISVDGGDDLTYSAWERRSNSVARGLAARGIRPGDRVGLLFEARHWADFAVAYVGARKCGCVAVLLSPGAARPDVERALADSRASGVLVGSSAVPDADGVWAARVNDVERSQDKAPEARPVEYGPMADLVSTPAPLAPARPHALPCGDPAIEAGPLVDGWLVHAWAPGSLAGQHALSLVLGGSATRAASLGAFTPDRFCTLLAERRASACGLSPALAAAILASGAPARHDLSAVERILLSGPPSPDLLARLRAAFPTTTVVEVEFSGASAPIPDLGASVAPVAVSQLPMLWHEQLTPGSFNLPCLVRRYQGSLDVAALESALSQLICRHEPLRSTFTLVGGAPTQVVHDHGGFRLPTLDLGHLELRERDTEVARLLADATARPFDLATGPLFEPRLIRQGPDDHLLVIRLHHTVFDDWSVDVFRRELSALYTAGLAGAPSPLMPPVTLFADSCRRDRALLSGEAGAAQRSWWRHELEGGPLSVQLPIGGGPEAGASGPGEPIRLDLPPSLASRLRALAPQLRATPFMTVLAAFSVLVGRSTGLDDLVIATVVAHRSRSDVEPLIGCFTKKIPLRLRLGGDPTFAELVARTRVSLLGALAHQDVAFDTAVQDSLGRPAAEHGVVPQVAVVFQGETPRQMKVALPGLAVGPYHVPDEARRERHFSSGPDQPEHPAWGDGTYLGTFLILSLVESPEGMALLARGVFDRGGGRRLLEDFQRLLEEVTAAPSRRVSELGGSAVHPPDPDVLDLRGFRASRTRVEAALAACPGVADVAVAVRNDTSGEPRLVAYVVADGGPTTLAQLRGTLWATLPGAPWPSVAVTVDALPRLPDGRVDIASVPPPPHAPPADAHRGSDGPLVSVLATMWGEIRGRGVQPNDSYWQDFSFLQVLVEAREAGLGIPDECVARARTVEQLVAALAAGAAQRG